MAKIGINISTGSIQQEEIIVGIDLGTTNSLIAIVHPQTKQPIALKEFDGSSIVPSIIHFNESGNIDIGEKAKPYLRSDPANSIFSVKRLIGKQFKDIQDQLHLFSYSIIADQTDELIKIKIKEKVYSPIELSALILNELKERAEHILKTPVNKVVITVPAYFNDIQRQATREAGKLAGLNVLRIINEPTAASLAYGIGLDKNQKKTVAVYDLGGGTFDISILSIEDGVFEVLSTNGDTYLGGDDIDNQIVQFWIQKYSLNINQINNPHQIRLIAETAKITLSQKSNFNFKDDIKNDLIDNFPQTNFPFELSLIEFEDLIQPMINKTIDCCKKALQDANLTNSEIDEVIMVGGSTRIPKIKQSISTFFNKQVNDSLNPDEVVAIGAAIQADILAGNNTNLLLLDITPLSLGIETIGGLMDVLIPRNSKIPTKTSRQYTTQKDGQTGININVFQGERDLVIHNRSLGAFTLKGIPNMPAGFPKIEVSFLIDADGVLTVKAKESRSGISQEIQINAKENLTDLIIEEQLLDSFSNAKEDIQQRAIIEAITEADNLIDISEKFLLKNKDVFMDEIEISQFKESILSLKESVQLKDKNKIHIKMEDLNKIATPIAERAMNRAISTALKGKNIN